MRAWNFIDLKGRKISNFKVLKYLPAQKKWRCRCVCGKLHDVPSQMLRTKKQKSCGCLQYEMIAASKWKGCGDISGDYWNTVKRGAIKRKLAFEISIQYAWKLFQEQQALCKLSKLPLILNRSKAGQTGSLDRINNTKGYVEGNVQWLHKDVNRMKSDFDQQAFIEVCKRIAQEARDGEARVCGGK